MCNEMHVPRFGWLLWNIRLQAGQHDDASVRVTPRWDMASLPAV